MAADQLLRSLDAAQREAVGTDAAPLAIVATAGAGKTRVLTARIAYRVATGRADAAHVLALTFTREAAAELRGRLRRHDIREPILAGTFHSVALRLLRDHALTRNAAPPVLAPDRLRLVREVVSELRLQVAPSAAAADLDWARARLVTPDGYEPACRRARRRSNLPAARFAEVVSAYEETKRRRGVVDFDDLLALTLRAARTDRAFADLVHWRFRHFFVDEAQDLNPLQFALLESWRAGRPDITLVGDPRQAIFGWNGADPAMLGEVETRLPGITVVSLAANYRCTPQVVRAGRAALSAAGMDDDTQSARSDGRSLQIRRHDTDRLEAAEVATQIRALLPHRSPNDIAVLARTNEQLDAFATALAAHGVRVARAAGASPLDMAVAEATRLRTRDALAEWAAKAVDDPVDVRRRVALEAVRYLAADTTGNFRTWVERYAPFDDLDPGDADPAVSLLTFHSAKGREWPVVFVTGVENGLVPHSSAVSPAQLAEEARLLYVAITRAGEQLTLSHAAARGKGGGPSPWLAEVAATAAADLPVAPPRRFDPPPPDPLEALHAWRAAVARAAGVPDTAVCPDRVLRSLHDDPPRSPAQLAARLGISMTAAERLTPPPLPA